MMKLQVSFEFILFDPTCSFVCFVDPNHMLQVQDGQFVCIECIPHTLSIFLNENVQIKTPRPYKTYFSYAWMAFVVPFRFK